MGRAKPVFIDGIDFPRKGDALAYLRAMLYRYDFEEKVSAQDASFLASALERHPDYIQKIGVGIDHFFVGRGDYGTRCFWIRRVDGTEERFSFKSCV